MKLEISAQLRGPDTRKVMQAIIRLRKELEKPIETLCVDEVSTITPVLRVGGSLGSFGEDGIQNIEFKNKVLVCDLVISPHNWEQTSSEEIYDILKPRVLESLKRLLAEAGLRKTPDFLNS
jgi:hypothetical protein